MRIPWRYFLRFFRSLNLSLPKHISISRNPTNILFVLPAFEPNLKYISGKQKCFLWLQNVQIELMHFPFTRINECSGHIPHGISFLRSFSISTSLSFAPFAEPITEVVGGPELHINKGSTINLTCIVKFAPEPPPTVVWSHNRQVSSQSLSSSPFKYALGATHSDHVTWARAPGRGWLDKSYSRVGKAPPTVKYIITFDKGLLWLLTFLRLLFAYDPHTHMPRSESKVNLSKDRRISSGINDLSRSLWFF